MKKKLFSLLTLLLVAVSGAWADATIAKLWVGNSEEVTSEGTITGTGATEGTASVAIENGTMVLTLNNFKFNGCGYNDSGIYYQSNANGDTPLIIKIEGDNEITLPGGTDKSLYGLFLYGGNGDHVFTITGSGSLTVTVGDGNLSNGIFVQQADLVLAGGTVTANAGSAGAEFKSLGVSVPQGTLTIDGCTLKASGSTTSASRGVNVNNNVTIKSGELEAYGYSKGIKNSGGDALVFAEGVTPTLFKAGDNEASATDVSKYEGQKYLHVVCTGGDEPAAPTGDGVNYALSVGTNEHGTVTFKVGENTVTTAKEGETVTVVITPNTGWVVNKPSAQWYAAQANARRRVADANIDLLKDFELNPVEGNPNAFTFTMKRANAEISVSYKKLLTNTDITIDDITALTYTGQAQEPVVTVKDGQTVLTLGTDYTVAYSNNTNAALANAAQNAPTVTITAVATSEKYSGETTKKFTINKKALTVKADNKSVTFGDDAPTYTETYDGFVNNETKAVLSGELALTCDYVKNQTGAGTYDITPSGLTSSNYDITFTKGTLTVGKKALEDGFIANIASLVYTGVAQEPAPVVTFNGMTLVKGTDYSVSYENNVNVGTATATVTALANSTKYSGTASQTFEIAKKALTVKADNKQVTYGDAAPTYTESYDGFVNNETKAVLSGELALACDYVKDQSGVGTYDITPSGYTSNNYDITFTNGTLTVGAKALENGFIADIDAVVYNAQAQEPAPVLTFHEMTLAAGTDYTVAYSNNTNAGTATVTCTGQGNYSGQAQKNFTIKPDTLTEVTLVDTLFMYNFKTPVEQTAVINEVKTKTLTVPAAQYDIQGNNATEPGQYTVTVTGKTNFTGSVSTTFTIKEQEIDGDAEETESGEEVEDVKVVVGVVSRDDQTLTIREINEGSSSSGEGITVNIPAQVNGWNVVSVDPNALSGLNNVTDINMPDTEHAIMIGDNAFPSTATIHAPLPLLDDYALMPSLKLNYESGKVESTVSPVNEYWTLGIGCDVIIPEEILVFVVHVKNTESVAIEQIPERQLNVEGTRIVKANNGVLLLGKKGTSYDLVAYSGRIASGTPIATTDSKSYDADNCLEPVIEKKHYDTGYYFVLQNNEFHSILAEGDEVKVPAGKAVLHLGNEQAGANSRVLKIDSEATGIENLTPTLSKGEGVFYDLNGRKITAPTKKGIYILNGKKVVIK